jgi:hypothetical protein
MRLTLWVDLMMHGLPHKLIWCICTWSFVTDKAAWSIALEREGVVGLAGSSRTPHEARYVEGSLGPISSSRPPCQAWQTCFTDDRVEQ